MMDGSGKKIKYAKNEVFIPQELITI